MNTMRTLTLKQLTDAGACEVQVELFREKFGESVEVTEELCRSVAGEFDWYWAAWHLLSPAARAAYDAAEATALGAYKAAEAPARATYDAAKATAWDAYEAAEAPARAAYYAAEATALGAYKAAVATAFARAYIDDTPDQTLGAP